MTECPCLGMLNVLVFFVGGFLTKRKLFWTNTEVAYLKKIIL